MNGVLEISELFIGRTSIEGVVRAGLRIERDMIDVTTAAGVTSLDPRWEHVDAAGHWHAVAKRADGELWLPTLEEHVEPNPEYDPNADPDWSTSPPNLRWRVCSVCGERVDPGTTTSHMQHYIAGEVRWRIEMTVADDLWWLPGRSAPYVVRALVQRPAANLGPSLKPREYFGVAHWHPGSVRGGVAGGTLVTGVFEGVGELGERVV